MVTMSSSFRNLTQRAANISPQLAVRADQSRAVTKAGSAEAAAAVDALSDLLTGANASGSELVRPHGTVEDRYETYGYPDLLAQLWALVDRPVGKGVHTRTRTVTVETANGPVETEVSESEYYNRPLTEEEHLYLAAQDRLKRRRVKPGEAPWLTHPELRG
jgi:hypothetical protein